MHNFKEGWEFLFSHSLHYIDTLGNNVVPVTEKDEIYLNKTKLVSGIRTIIYDILLLYSNLDAILVYLECVCKYFLKYRFSFRLDRCDFLKTRVKYVCHEIIKAVNFPALLKFDPINNCILPFTGQSLFCFIVPVNFYHIYAPYFEI